VKTGSDRRRRARVRERPAAYRARLDGPLYCDASALLKLYFPEPGSDELNRLLEGREDLLASDLAVTEIVSALARRAREGALEWAEASRVQRALLAALDGGTCQRVELTRDVHRVAERLLLVRSGASLRAADALHLALAVSARAAGVATFDARLSAAARGVGLTAYPPAL
jgi:predicted nucleic acid-binding protein